MKAYLSLVLVSWMVISVAAEPAPPQVRTFVREAGILRGNIASADGVVTVCDSRMSRTPTYRSALESWQARNQSLLSEAMALEKRARSLVGPALSDERAAQMDRDVLDNNRAKFLALNIREASEF